MRIWVDADGCPASVRKIICRAASRSGVNAVFVSNRIIGLPDSPEISLVVTEADPGSTDDVIHLSVSDGDIVVTADIPLAKKVIDSGASVVHPRGGTYTKDNISERLSLRDYSQVLRDLGEDTKESKRRGHRRAANFADSFDKELAKRFRE